MESNVSGVNCYEIPGPALQALRLRQMPTNGRISQRRFVLWWDGQEKAAGARGNRAAPSAGHHGLKIRAGMVSA